MLEARRKKSGRSATCIKKSATQRLLMEKRATESKLTEVENEVATTIDDAVKFADESRPSPRWMNSVRAFHASDDK